MRARSGERRAGWRVSAVALASSVLLAACGGGGNDAPTATVGPTATATAVPPTPTPLPPASVGKVVWTESVDPTTNAPGKAVSTFTTDVSAIYAVVKVADLPAGSVLSAAWTYNDVALNGTSSSVVTSTPVVSGYVQFHLARGDAALWPDGTYAIAISLDGQEVRSAKIDLVAS